MRLAPLVAMLWFAPGCFSVPQAEGPFSCETDPRCPDGKVCSNGVCGDPAAGGGDDGGDDGGDAPAGYSHFGSGSFTRGCDPGPDCPDDAQPAATVSLTSFLLQSSEVTQADYATCVTAGKCVAPAALYHPDTEADLPVRGLTKHDAESYCDFVHARLPTEAQWESAARQNHGRLRWRAEDRAHDRRHP
jgi:hypothetical protein